MKLRDARIAKAVIAGKKIGDIAADESVTERQVYRILAKPEVRDVVDAAARALTRTATLAVQRGASAAAAALVSMSDGTAPPNAARTAAAGKVLDVAIRALEVEDLLSRLLELELLVAEREKTRALGEPT